MDSKGKTISEIFDSIEYEVLIQECSDLIQVIRTDSRTVEPGNMFIAISGEKFDGHDFIEEAFKNGATYIVMNKDMTEKATYQSIKGATVISVEDTRICLPYLIRNLYSNPTKHFKLIGVTGTNGKTSVTTIAKHILMKLNHKTGLIGTINNYIDNEIINIKTTTPTTPDCVELGMIMNEFVSREVEIALMEVSSMALKNHRVDGCNFDIAVFTNLTPEHLDNHVTMEDYMNSKLKLFDMAKKAVVNVDDEHFYPVIARCPEDTIRFGIKNTRKCDIYAKNIVYNDGGVYFTVVYDNKEYIAYSSTPSEFAVYNSLAVMGICLLLNQDLEKVVDLLNDKINVEGRYDVIKDDSSCTVIIDYAHTPAALENLLKSVRNNKNYKRIITVFGCGGDRDRTKRSVMGGICQKLSDVSIITSDNPRSENPVTIINDIMEGMDRESENFYIMSDRKAAIEFAILLANWDDVVVIAGKGHEKYQVLNGYSVECDDKKIAWSTMDKLASL